MTPGGEVHDNLTRSSPAVAVNPPGARIAEPALYAYADACPKNSICFSTVWPSNDALIFTVYRLFIIQSVPSWLVSLANTS